MKKKTSKYFLQTLVISMLFVLIFGGTSVYAAKKTGFVTQNGKTYYINKKGEKHKGWLELKGKKYYFDKETGVQLKGWAKDSEGKLVRYFTNKSGAMVTGFVTDSKGNTRYFNRKTGILTRGWLELKGQTYYFTSGSGVMARGWLKNKKDQKRYFDQDGRMKKGWAKFEGGQYRYFNKKNGIMYTGMKKIGSSYYYFDENGVRCQKGFFEIDGKTYYFSQKNGKRHHGWLESENKKYYFGTNGVMYTNRTAAVDGQTYVFDKNGVATVSKVQIEGDNVIVYDEVRNKNIKLWKTYLQIPGISTGEVSDVELLAALCESEAGDQGHEGMVAVALCVLNRTLDRGFPSNMRHVIFEGGKFAQYSVVSNGQLAKRINGTWYDKAGATAAAKQALRMFDDYVKKGKPRKLKGFKKPDFDYKYFMMTYSFHDQRLDFDRVDSYEYLDHTFFVDWISPR